MPLLTTAFESSPNGMLIVDSKGRIHMVNREIERLFCYSRDELLGLPVEILIPERYKTGHSILRAGYFKNPEPRMMGKCRELFGLRKDGIEVPVEIGITPVETEEGVFVISTIVDISYRKHAEAEQRKLEEQLRQAQKMEALGQLASGIAHDINNILQAIQANAEIAVKDTIEPVLVDKFYEIIMNVERGKHVVERILSFSRQKSLNVQPLDLKKQTEATIAFLKAMLPPEVQLQLHAEPGLPHILADVNSVDLILMNLTNNAAQAMQSGGKLDIALESFYAKDNFVRMHPELNEGCYVRMLVRDTGEGMNEEIREKAFDPFFTTKASQGGSGLGLSIVQRLVLEHGGSIWIDSEEGAGTAVSCLFPAANDSAVEYIGDDISMPYGNSQRIICVDDESALQTVNNQVLSGLGYRPSVFVDPRVALDVFKSSPAEFDLAVIDYSMPFLNGIKLTSELLKIRPGFPVVIVSGSVKGSVEKQFKKVGAKALIRKPYTRLELAHTLFSVLNSD